MGDPVSFGDGRYSVIHKLGEGGMAVVYLAVDNRLLRPVAIKVPHPELLWRGKDNLVRRFGQETITMARATHPHTVTLYDAGAEVIEDIRTPFLVMEYIGGVSLEAVIKTSSKSRFGALPPGIACQLILGTLRAISTLHNGGLIHRDIKPANIMVGWDGKIVKVMDFGIARIVQEEGERNTQTGVMGTLHYIAPEQFRNTKDADARADIYSIGATLHGILTGKEPENIREALHNLNEDDLEFVSLPDGLREIVFGTTRLYREDRLFQTSQAMEQAIEKVVNKFPVDDKKFHAWLDTRRATSAAESALRRAFGVGYTMVPEAEVEGARTGFTQWFESEPSSKNQTSADPIQEPSDPPKAVERPKALVPRSWIAGGVLAAIVLVSATVGVTKLSGADESETITIPSPLPVQTTVQSGGLEKEGKVGEEKGEEGENGLEAVEPSVLVKKESGPKTGKAGKVVSGVVKEEPVIAEPVAIEPVVVVPIPTPETGTVLLAGGASSIQLIGEDGSRHQQGKVPTGIYRISADFETKGAVTNAGNVTVIAGDTISLKCDEKFTICKPL